MFKGIDVCGGNDENGDAGGDCSSGSQSYGGGAYRKIAADRKHCRVARRCGEYVLQASKQQKQKDPKTKTCVVLAPVTSFGLSAIK